MLFSVESSMVDRIVMPCVFFNVSFLTLQLL